jgi:peroxiredoxin
LIPSPGDPVPDVELLDPDGTPRRLSDLLTGPTLLIFLRHLA